MKKVLMQIAITAILLCFLSAFLGCGNGPKKPSVEDLIDEGKSLLSQDKGVEAFLVFTEVLNRDSTNLDGEYGICLADVLQIANTFNMITELIAPSTSASHLSPESTSRICQLLDQCDLLSLYNMTYYECVSSYSLPFDSSAVDCLQESGTCEEMKLCFKGTYPPTEGQCEEFCRKTQDCGYLQQTDFTLNDCVKACPSLYASTQIDCFLNVQGSCDAVSPVCFPNYGSTIQETVKGFTASIAHEMFSKARDLEQHRNFQFYIDPFSFTFFNLLFQPSLSGVNDMTEVHFVNSIGQLFSGAINLILGLNLNFSITYINNIDLDLSVIQNMNFNELTDEDIDAIQSILQDVEGILNDLLNDPIYRDFGALADQRRVQDASKNIGLMFGELADVVQSLKDDVDVNQWVRPIHYIDSNYNQFWDVDESMVIPGVGELDYGLANALQQIFLGLQTNFYDGEPFQFDSLLPLFDYFDLHWVDIVVNILATFGIHEIDLAAPLHDPGPDGIRPLLYELKDLLALIDAVLNLL